MKLDGKACFHIGLTAFALYLCIQFWPAATQFAGLLLSAAMPLLIGGVIAYLVNILMSFYEKHYFANTKTGALAKSRRPVCMALAFATLIAVVVLIVWLIVPELGACVQVILAELPGFINDVVAWVEERGVLPENIAASLEGVDWRSRIGEVIQVLTSGIGNAVDVVVAAVSSVVSWVVTVVLAVIFALYLLSGKESLCRQFRKVTRRYLKETWCSKLEYVLSVLNDSFRKYIVGQCTEAVILGVLCALGMMILQLPYATMIGALIGFTALIPVAGAYIGGGVGAFMIFTVSPVKAVIFVVFLVILQQVEGNLIYPKVVGSSLGLPAIWVLTAVTVGGGVLGIPGMLLGVPITSAVYRIVRDDVNKCPQETDKADISPKSLDEP